MIYIFNKKGLFFKLVLYIKYIKKNYIKIIFYNILMDKETEQKNKKNEYCKKWNIENKDKIKEYTKKYYNDKFSNDEEKMTKQREAVLKRYYNKKELLNKLGIQPKPRGRPKKEIIETEIKVKKANGRPRKQIIKDTLNIINFNENNNNENTLNEDNEENEIIFNENLFNEYYKIDNE